MTRKPLRCRFGLHSYVQRHPDGERPAGPDHRICRRCGKHTDVPFGNVPGMGLGGGGGGGGF
ncbi:hypothetical protein [Geodermatophilus marinus]|uniref:hypothetical protein n=1 Tax=Geodermatophilus sp. LHW52908 TaxID=2303986 RepID=UPI000E3E63CC|nr:hypothetical protein [Geodermatophilus sp. LHW52908]RFU20863.1 hypothetical protein D0Z06_13635 [Geodermatophilus sp. LHW52908]